MSSSEILAEYQYYPFGLQMKGDWQGNESLHREKYQYNGIEYVQDHGIDLNFATFRTLDPCIGRWLGVDPKAEDYLGMNPYTAMGNSPMVLTDPHGDAIPLPAVAFANAIVQESISHETGGNFFSSAGMAFASTFVSSGIGSLFGPVGSLGNELGRAGVHGLSGGIQSRLAGGNFWQGATSSALASGIGSGVDVLGGGALAQVLGGGITGGIGAEIAGWNFWQAFGQGISVTAFNHLLRRTLTAEPIQPPKDSKTGKPY